MSEITAAFVDLGSGGEEFSLKQDEMYVVGREESLPSSPLPSSLIKIKRDSVSRRHLSISVSAHATDPFALEVVLEQLSARKQSFIDAGDTLLSTKKAVRRKLTPVKPLRLRLGDHDDCDTHEIRIIDTRKKLKHVTEGAAANTDLKAKKSSNFSNSPGCVSAQLSGAMTRVLPPPSRGKIVFKQPERETSNSYATMRASSPAKRKSSNEISETWKNSFAGDETKRQKFLKLMGAKSALPDASEKADASEQSEKVKSVQDDLEIEFLRGVSRSSAKAGLGL